MIFRIQLLLFVLLLIFQESNLNVITPVRQPIRNKCLRLGAALNFTLGQEWCSVLGDWEGADDLMLLKEARHWMSWTGHPPAHWKSLLFGTWAFVITTLGMVGNLMVVLLFARNKHLRVERMYKISLGMSDLISSVITYMLVVSSVIRVWPFGKILCNFYSFLHCMCGLVSIFSLAEIAATRSATLLISPRSRRQNALINRREAYYVKCTVVALTWITCASLSAPPLFQIGRYSLSGYMTTCCYDFVNPGRAGIIFYSVLLCLGFFMPLLAIAGSYIVIGRALWRKNRQMLALGKLEDLKRSHQTENLIPMKSCLKSPRLEAETGKSDSLRTVDSPQVHWEPAGLSQIAGTTSLLICCFLVSWTPYGALSVVGQLCTSEECRRSWFMSPTVAMFAALCAKSATVFNPLVYSYLDGQFIRELQLFFGYQVERSRIRSRITTLTGNFKKKESNESADNDSQMDREIKSRLGII